MPPATATKPLPRIVTRILSEDYVRSPGPLRVDRENGIIYGVKICGWDSSNNRRYLPEAGRSAVHLYEGAKVFTDHPDRNPLETRKDGDAFGLCRKVEWKPDGVFCQLHYFKSHPLAERIIEDCERGLGIFGMSHNAQGEGSTDANGIFVVSKITDVRSVDLVTDAATVKNLWESRKMATKLTKAQLLEMGYEMDEPAAAPPPEAPADWRAHLGNMISAIVQDESLDPAAIKAKLLAILKLLEAGEAKKETPEDESEDAKKKEEEETEEARKREAAKGKQLLEAKFRRLVKLAGLKEDAKLVDALVTLGDDEGVGHLEFLQEYTFATRRGSLPRSAPPGNGAGKMDRKEFASKLKSYPE